MSRQANTEIPVQRLMKGSQDSYAGITPIAALRR